MFTLNKNAEFISGVVGFDKFSLPYNEGVYKVLSDLEEQYYYAPTASTANSILKDAKDYIAKQTSVEEVEHSNTGTTEMSKNLHHDGGKFYLVGKNGVVSDIAIPKPIVDRMLEAFHEGITVEPYIKCWTLFLRNPNFSLEKAELFAKYITMKHIDQDNVEKLVEEGYAHDTAVRMSTYDEVTITRSGLISTYKFLRVILKDGESIEDVKARIGSDNTYDKVYAEDLRFLPPVMGRSGDALTMNGELTHEVQVGALHELQNWDQVNCNDSASCVKGIHAGNLTYIKGYGGGNTLLANALISPSDIGAFVQGYGEDSGAVRVIRNFIVSINIAPNRGRYHESTLLDKIESVWNEEREKAIEETNALIAKIKKAQDQINAI